MMHVMEYVTVRVIYDQVQMLYHLNKELEGYLITKTNYQTIIYQGQGIFIYTTVRTSAFLILVCMAVYASFLIKQKNV